MRCTADSEAGEVSASVAQGGVGARRAARGRELEPERPECEHGEECVEPGAREESGPTRWRWGGESRGRGEREEGFLALLDGRFGHVHRTTPCGRVCWTRQTRRMTAGDGLRNFGRLIATRSTSSTARGVQSTRTTRNKLHAQVHTR